MATKRRVGGGLQVGFGLVSASVVIAVIALSLASWATTVPAVRVVILVLFGALIVAIWGQAILNGRQEREARKRLLAEHPGALVERVRLWALPHERVAKNVPLHFLIADAERISFENVDQTVLARVDVADLGFVDLVAAQGDTARDKAVTLIYGDDEQVIQFFTLTYSAQDRLRDRVRTAIGWPPA